MSINHKLKKNDRVFNPTMALVFWRSCDFNSPFFTSLDRKELWNVVQSSHPLFHDGAGKKATLFQFDWKAQQWNLIVAMGVIVGAFLASNYIAKGSAVAISQKPLINWLPWESKTQERVLLPKCFFQYGLYRPQ